MRRVAGMLGTALALLSVGLCSVASAQEVEPNNVCPLAQEGGEVTSPRVLEGVLDPRSATNRTDVDFFRFTAPPGAPLNVTIAAAGGGVFGEDCNLIADLRTSTPAMVDIRVPASGVFLVAVATIFDGQYSGDGSDPNVRPYQMTLTPIPPDPPAIGSISGRVVNARDGSPLAATLEAPVAVELSTCVDGTCRRVTSDWTDARGRFRFERIFSQSIPAGDFRIRASAASHDDATTDLSVAADEDADVGDIALTPRGIVISAISPCSVIPIQGGRCEYSVTIQNNTEVPFSGTAHSIVRSASDRIQFEASTRPGAGDPRRARLELPAHTSQRVTFSFRVPSFATNTEAVCARLFVGANPSPLFDVVRRLDLFCVTKGAQGLQVLSPAESVSLFNATDESPVR